MLSSLTPIAMKVGMRSTRAAASPQTPTHMPALRAASQIERDRLEHGRMVGAIEMSDARIEPVGRHDILGQVIGADRKEGDFARQILGQQSRRRRFDHDAEIERAMSDARRFASSARHSSISALTRLTSSTSAIIGAMTLTLPTRAARNSARNCGLKISGRSRHMRTPRQPRNGLSSCGKAMPGAGLSPPMSSVRTITGDGAKAEASLK